jgi:hypothetical protein
VTAICFVCKHETIRSGEHGSPLQTIHNFHHIKTF